LRPTTRRRRGTSIVHLAQQAVELRKRLLVAGEALACMT